MNDDPAAPMKITWLASYAKSGNTWVRLFLSRMLLGDAWHIDKAQAQIPHILSIVQPKKDWGQVDLGDPAVAKDVASMWIPIQKRVRAADIFRHRNTILMKTHNAFVTLEGHAFSDLEQSEKAVYIVRDPRDVLLSLAHHVGEPVEKCLEGLLSPFAMVLPDEDYVPEFWGDWGGHYRSWRDFNLGPQLTLRYEDLLETPGKTFRALLAFLDWRDDDTAIDAAIDAVLFDKLRKTEEERGFIEAPGERKFFRRGVAGGWRDHPEKDLFRRLEDALADEMRLLGYE